MFTTLHNSFFRLRKPGLPNSDSRKLHSFQPHCPVLQLLHIKSPLPDQQAGALTLHSSIRTFSSRAICYTPIPHWPFSGDTLLMGHQLLHLSCPSHMPLPSKDHSKEYYCCYLQQSVLVDPTLFLLFHLSISSNSSYSVPTLLPICKVFQVCTHRYKCYLHFIHWLYNRVFMRV